MLEKDPLTLNAYKSETKKQNSFFFWRSRFWISQCTCVEILGAEDDPGTDLESLVFDFVHMQKTTFYKNSTHYFQAKMLSFQKPREQAKSLKVQNKKKISNWSFGFGEVHE